VVDRSELNEGGLCVTKPSQRPDLFLRRSQASIEFRILSRIALCLDEACLYKTTARQIRSQASDNLICPRPLLGIETTIEKVSDTLERFGLGSCILGDCDQQVLNVGSRRTISYRSLKFANLFEFILCFLSNSRSRQTRARRSPLATIQAAINARYPVDDRIATRAVAVTFVKAVNSSARFATIAISGPKTSGSHKGTD
jgi:hypothetical protein